MSGMAHRIQRDSREFLHLMDTPIRETQGLGEPIQHDPVEVAARVAALGRLFASSTDMAALAEEAAA